MDEKIENGTDDLMDEMPPAEPFDSTSDNMPQIIPGLSEETPVYQRGAYTIIAILVVVVIMTLISAITVPKILNARREIREKETISQLKSIGSSQIAYRSANSNKLYGTFSTLKKQGYVPGDATPGDMIEQYSLSWLVSDIPVAADSTIAVGRSYPGRFTVIAFPKDGGFDNLSTFGISEDLVVRVYNPDNNNDVDDVRTWDPIL